MAETRPRDREATEKLLVNAGRQLIKTTGYETIRTRDVANFVGCNHGLITQYFGNKLGLFTEVLHLMGLEIRTQLASGETVATTVGSPLMSTYWRLLAALLAAGMDPSNAINEGFPVVSSIIERAEAMTGKNFAGSRDVAVHAIMMIGGYHVFGEAFMKELSSGGDEADAVLGIQRTILMILQGVANQQ